MIVAIHVNQFDFNRTIQGIICHFPFIDSINVHQNENPAPQPCQKISPLLIHDLSFFVMLSLIIFNEMNSLVCPSNPLPQKFRRLIFVDVFLGQ